MWSCSSHFQSAFRKSRSSVAEGLSHLQSDYLPDMYLFDHALGQYSFCKGNTISVRHARRTLAASVLVLGIKQIQVASESWQCEVEIWPCACNPLPCGTRSRQLPPRLLPPSRTRLRGKASDRGAADPSACSFPQQRGRALPSLSRAAQLSPARQEASSGTRLISETRDWLFPLKRPRTASLIRAISFRAA